jgi:yeast amino acid transporter
VFTGLFCFWKIYKRTKAWAPREIDFVTGIPSIEETEGPEEKPTTFLGKVSAFIF